MSKNKCIKEIEIKINGKEWEEALEKAYKIVSKDVKIDGFRPGKAPKDMVMKKYGQDVYMEAADLCIEPAYAKMIEDNQDLFLVAQPDIRLKELDENGLTFEFVLTTKPEVKLGKYKGLDVKKESVEVSQEEVDHVIEEMRHRYAEDVVKEGSLEEGDIAVIDFEGFDQGVPFEGGKGEKYSLEIGSGTFIPGFEEQLIGMNKDEEKEIEVTFPADYHSEDLKGKPVTFRVKLHEVKSIQVPEINEDFFADLGMDDVHNIEELQAQIKENIQAHKEMDVENKYIDDLLEEASKTVEIDIPDVMIYEEAHRMVHQYEDTLRMQGLSLEQFYQFTNSNEEALKEQMKDEAIKRVTYRLMLEEIAKVENIQVTDEDADKKADELAEKYHMEKDEFLKNFGGLDMVKYDMEMRKAIEILKGE